MSITYNYKNNLYLNITNRCTNKCDFCLRNISYIFAGYNLKLKKEPSKAEIIEKTVKNYSGGEIVFCGIGEPLVRLNDVLDISRELKKKLGVKIRVDTNGQAKLYYPVREIAKELSEVIDAVSISLNAENAEKYNTICRPESSFAYISLLGFINECKDFLDVTLTVVNLPEINIEKCKKIADNFGVKFRVRNLVK